MLANKLLQLGLQYTPMEIAVDSSTSFVESDSCGPQFGSINITVTKGKPPYTYSWLKVSGDGGLPINPEAQNMTASLFMCPGDTLAGIYQVTVTDSTAANVSQNIQLDWIRANPLL